MFDTIRLYRRGVNNYDFKLNIDCYKKQISEKNELIRYYNNFETDTGSVYVECDEMMKQGVNISFSAPLIANGSQIENFKLSDCSRLLNNLYKILNGKIDIDLEKMKVSRLDITSNILTEHQAKDYINTFQRSYINHRNYKTDVFKNESFTIYNKSRRFVFYDKIIEIVQKGGKISVKLRDGMNILRFEIQNKKGRDVKALLKKDYKFSDLFNESVFIDCIDVQSKCFKMLFLKNKEQVNMFESDKQLIAHLFNLKGRKMLVHRFLVKKQLDNGSLSLQEIENLIKDYYSERGGRAVMKELKELKFLNIDYQYSMLSEISNKISQLHYLLA